MIVWKLTSYSEIKVPIARYGRQHCIGIVVGEKGERKPVWIDGRYSRILKYGLKGRIVEKWTPHGVVNVFIPEVEELEKPVLVVVGACNDLGREIVLEALKSNFKVVGLDSKLEELEKLKLELESLRGDFSYYSVNLNSTSEIEKALDEISKKTIRIVGVVNSLVYWEVETGKLSGIELLEELFKERVETSYNVCEASARVLSKLGSGVIVNVLSLPSIIGIGGMLEASIVEAAVLGLTKSIASKYLRENVKCNAVVHGISELEVRGRYKARKIKEIYMKTPMKTFVDYKSVAKAVLYMVSEGSEYATGTVLVLDGGVTKLL